MTSPCHRACADITRAFIRAVSGGQTQLQWLWLEAYSACSLIKVSCNTLDLSVLLDSIERHRQTLYIFFHVHPYRHTPWAGLSLELFRQLWDWQIKGCVFGLGWHFLICSSWRYVHWLCPSLYRSIIKIMFVITCKQDSTILYSVLLFRSFNQIFCWGPFSIGPWLRYPCDCRGHTGALCYPPSLFYTWDPFIPQNNLWFTDTFWYVTLSAHYVLI